MQATYKTEISILRHYHTRQKLFNWGNARRRILPACRNDKLITPSLSCIIIDIVNRHMRLKNINMM